MIQADGTFQRNRYDAEGLRAELEENGRLCRFVFHQGEIVAEEQDGVAAVSRYLRGHGVEYLEQDEEQFPVLKDEQSSTVFLLDREHEIQNYYEYDAFGKVKTSADKIQNRILYTGQQYDGMAEQYYLRARYYNPVIGRFIQEDPYRGDGLNLYAYCGNNPVRYFDPSGYSGGLNCPGVGFASKGKPLTPQQKKMIEQLRANQEVTVYSYEEARILLDNMPELSPAVYEGKMPNPTGRMADGFADPPGTYRGDLINIHDPLGPVHPDVRNPDHANFPHYNIKLPNRKKAAIIIKGEDRDGINWFNTTYEDE